MAKTGQKLSELLGELPAYYLQKGKVECDDNLKEKVLQKLIEQTKGLKTNTLDGVKIWFEDKSSILIRPSGTEPIYRLYAEAKTEKKAAQLVKDYSLKLKKIIDRLRN
jgi:phosphomannomutase/phosphoglucomutase